MGEPLQLGKTTGGGGFAVNNEFQQHIVEIIPKLARMVKEDEYVNVVCACLETLANLLKSCKASVTNHPGIPEQIVECVHLVMRSKCACMDSECAGEGEEEGQEAEQDEMLFEYAGEILPSLGIAMTSDAAAPAGINSFSPYFAGIFPMLLKKTKPKCTVAERSFSLGSLAECMISLSAGGALEPFIQHLMPIYTSAFRDEDKDIRNNAIYGIGELALHAGSPAHTFFPAILQALSSQVAIEKDPRCLDQIVGAVCRLIVANRAAVPVEQVMPVVFANLPLREDFEEYDAVLRCLHLLYAEGNDQVKVGMPKILDMCAVIYDKKVAKEDGVFADDETFMEKVRPLVQTLVKQYRSTFPIEFEDVLNSMRASQKQEIAAKLENICS